MCGESAELTLPDRSVSDCSTQRIWCVGMAAEFVVVHDWPSRMKVSELGFHSIAAVCQAVDDCCVSTDQAFCDGSPVTL